jgi:hypothetical protein
VRRFGPASTARIGEPSSLLIFVAPPPYPAVTDDREAAIFRRKSIFDFDHGELGIDRGPSKSVVVS